MPLTADRAKPAVPFAGIYRLIDFALSNVVNSGYLQVVVLTQYKSHSLDRHVTQTWRMSTMLGNYVAPVPAQQRVGKHWYLGSADAIYQSLNLIKRRAARHRGRGRRRPRLPDGLLADGRPARRERRRLHGRRDPAADRAGRPVRRHRRGARRPARIREFLEKPTDPVGLPDSPGEVLASMGNYVFDADALVEAVTQDADRRRLQARHGRRHRAVRSCAATRPASTTSRTTTCPARPTATAATGATSGRSASYYAAHMDVVSPLPVFNLYNFEWPIYTSYGPQPPAKLVQGADGRCRRRRRGGAVARGRGQRRHRAPVGALAGGAGRAGRRGRGLGADERRARRRRRGRAQRDPRQERRSCPPGAEIGVDLEADAARGFVVEDGLTVLGKDQRVPGLISPSRR